MRFFRQLAFRKTGSLEALKGFVLVLGLVVAPLVCSVPAFAELPKPSELNKNTDPIVLRKYLKGINGLLKAKGPDPEAYSTKGQLLEWLKDYSEAVKAYSKAIEMKPKNGLYRLGKANCLRYQDKHIAAEKEYTKAINFGKATTEAYTGRALSRMNLKNYDESICDAESSLKMDPNDELAWYAKAASELDSGRVNESIISISKAIKLSPNDAELYVVRSRAYWILGKQEKAKSDNLLYKKYSKKQ